VFVIFGQKEISKKVAHEMLVILTTGMIGFFWRSISGIGNSVIIVYFFNGVTSVLGVNFTNQHVL
jgi:hypothetical protein